MNENLGNWIMTQPNPGELLKAWSILIAAPEPIEEKTDLLFNDIKDLHMDQAVAKVKKMLTANAFKEYGSVKRAASHLGINRFTFFHIHGATKPRRVINQLEVT